MASRRAAANTKKFSEIMNALGQEAKMAGRILSSAQEKQIIGTLESLATLLLKQSAFLIASNKQDLAQGKKLSEALVDRLTLTEDRIKAMADGVRTVTALPDPTGQILEERKRPNGLKIYKVSVPIGTLGMIYESRPNVTIDAAALSLRSRNAIILRGGSECMTTNRALHRLVQQALEENDLPAAAVSMLPSQEHALVDEMLAAHQWIDVLIPRGGRSLIEAVQTKATMPVFSHLDGICHVYIHSHADADMAEKILLNAKMRRTGICGAAETLLLDRALSEDTRTRLITSLIEAGCAVVGDPEAQQLHPDVAPATDEDWTTEYLAAKISVKHVESVDAAIQHINCFGSHHTDSIITQDRNAKAQFQIGVDSAIVMHNASTQFADGGEFGMGAEIGISTGRLHARGPVGVTQLTTYKYIVDGSGQVRP